MVEISENGKKALRIIFTDYLTRHNSYNIKDKLGISSAGSLKLLRNLSDKNILTSEKIGNAIFYKPNLKNEYVLKLLELVLLDNSKQLTYVKGWIYDLRRFIKTTNAILLFGSILKKGKDAGDVDVCFILKNTKNYPKLQSEIDAMNKNNRLRIHPLYLTQSKFETKLKEKDKPLIEAVKNCSVVHGVELFVKMLKNVQS